MKKNFLKTLFLGSILGCSIETAVVVRKLIEQKREKNDNIEKMKEFYGLLVQWVKNDQNAKRIANYFTEKGYKTAAIYGIKEIGELLYSALEGTDITVKYIIDKSEKPDNFPVPVVLPDGELEAVDVIVVTAIHYYDDIEELLEKRVPYDIISVEDIIYELGNN